MEVLTIIHQGPKLTAASQELLSLRQDISTTLIARMPAKTPAIIFIRTMSLNIKRGAPRQTLHPNMKTMKRIIKQIEKGRISIKTKSAHDPKPRGMSSNGKENNHRKEPMHMSQLRTEL